MIWPHHRSFKKSSTNSWSITFFNNIFIINKPTTWRTLFVDVEYPYFFSLSVSIIFVSSEEFSSFSSLEFNNELIFLLLVIVSYFLKLK